MGISGARREGPRGDINVTPLVDIVLVLLVIFLLAMPIQVRSITIEVPPDLPPKHYPDQSPLEIVGGADGSVTLTGEDGESRVQRVKLAAALRERLTGVDVVFVDFEDAVKYRDVISVMDTVRGVSAVKIALKVREADRGR